jgi:hypothetical protein
MDVAGQSTCPSPCIARQAQETLTMDTYNDELSSGSSSAFFVGLACGAALGVAVALLLAPQAGTELRRQVADSADQLRRRANSLYNDASRRVGDVVGRGQQAWSAGREAYTKARPNGHAEGIPS